MTASETTAGAHRSFSGAKTLLITAIAAGALSAMAWGAGEALRVKELVAGRPSATSMPNRKPGTELSVPLATQNSAVSYALLGGLLSLGAGISARVLMEHRSVTEALPAGIIGLIIGAAGGGAAAYFLTPVYLNQLETADVTRSILIHLGIWGAIGAGAGIAFGIGAANRGVFVHALAGGIVGGSLAAVIFDIIGGFFTLARTERPLSDEMGTRIAAHILVGLAVAAGIAVVTSQRPRASVNQA